MQKTKIEWCDYTWNPVTGCKRGCEYCYARKIHNRFNKTPFSEIVFHENRLNDPIKVKKPSKIFVGSMSDIQYWEQSHVNKIIKVCEQCPQHTFMLLSKNHLSYYLGLDWPDNTMCGLTISSCIYLEQYIDINYHAKFSHRPFLSIEPLLGKFGKLSAYDDMELIIVGAMTGNGATPPMYEWIQSIKDSVPEDKIIWKNNIRKYL